MRQKWVKCVNYVRSQVLDPKSSQFGHFEPFTKAIFLFLGRKSFSDLPRVLNQVEVDNQEFTHPHILSKDRNHSNRSTFQNGPMYVSTLRMKLSVQLCI